MLRLLVGLQLLLLVGGFSFFQTRIPNGDRIPHPCWPNYLWHGVGHRNVAGGGERNPFGMDFDKAGKTFTKELCEMDSDGDDKTNGEELGDPDCMWVAGEGNLPEWASGVELSHPEGVTNHVCGETIGVDNTTLTFDPEGICEPWDTEKCRKINGADWDFCSHPVYECEDTKAADVRNITLQFPETEVPAKETNYFCMLFDLPADQDYHIVGDQPFVDNLEVMHHILVYGCDVINDELISQYSQPKKCAMLAQSACGTQLGGWTVGSLGTCSNGLEAGLRFGKTSYKKVLMEFHWNNPRKAAGMKDKSGMTIHYTPNLRKYDMGILATGQIGLFIPPKQDIVHMDSTCKAKCTEQTLTEPIKIVSIGLHMHYLGFAGYVHHYRDGKLLRVLASDDVYFYDSPVEHEVNPPAIILPGDELVTRCTYKSTYRNDITYYGDSTQQEMCFAFIAYYPEAGFRDCLQYGEIDSCSLPGQEFAPTELNGCPLGDQNKTDILFENLLENCDVTGQKCLPSCRKILIDDVHPCFKGDVKHYYEFVLPYISDELTFIVAALRSCDMERLTLTSLGIRLVSHQMIILVAIIFGGFMKASI